MTTSNTPSNRYACGSLYFVNPPLMSSEMAYWAQKITKTSPRATIIIPKEIVDDEPLLDGGDAEVLLLQGMDLRLSHRQTLLSKPEFSEMSRAARADLTAFNMPGYIGYPYLGACAIGMRPNALVLLNEAGLQRLARPRAGVSLLSSEEHIAIVMARPQTAHEKIRAISQIAAHTSAAERWIYAHTERTGLCGTSSLHEGVSWSACDPEAAQLLQASLALEDAA